MAVIPVPSSDHRGGKAHARARVRAGGDPRRRGVVVREPTRGVGFFHVEQDVQELIEDFLSPGVVEVRPETFPRALRHRKWRRSRGDPPARSNRGRRFDGGDLSPRVGSRRRSLARRRLARPPSPGASNPNARLVGVGDGSPSRRSRYRRPSARWIGGDAPRAVANPAPPAPRAPPRHCRVPRTEGRAGRDREDTPRTMPFVQLLFLFPNRAICGFIITTGCAYEKNTISAVFRGASICRREDAKCR